MIPGKEQASIMRKCLEKRTLSEKIDTFIHRKICGKKEANNGKVFREKRVRERRAIHSDTE
jgi:hypothetical protein